MRVGIYQPAAGGLSLDQRLARLRLSIEVARQNSNADLELVLCPELFISGYNVGDQLHEYADYAEGETFEKVAAISRQLATAIVYGYPEQSDNCLHNSAAFVSADGELLANHRKRLNSPGGYEDSYFTSGEDRTIFEFRGFRIAILICYEVEFPELVREVASRGAQLILVPTALASQWGVVANHVIATRAFENGVWVAYANHAGHENGLDYLGSSRIVAPNGEVAAQAGDQEMLISAEVDIKSVNRAQQRLPYLEALRNLPSA